MQEKTFNELKGLSEASQSVNYTYPFRSPRNSRILPKAYEENDQPSKTIPDQTMSIGEILKRYASGLPLGGVKTPLYEGEESEVPANWDKLDLSEKHDLIEANRARIAQMQEDLQKPKPTTPEKPKKAQTDEPNGAAPSAGASGEAEA